MVEIISGSLELGLIFSILSLGLFLSFRILNLADLTVDASFVTGLAVSSIFTSLSSPYLGIGMAFIAGCICGLITGFLYTLLKIDAVLAGILTLTGLYSINIRLMDNKPSIFLGGYKNVFDPFLNKYNLMGYDFGYLIALLMVVILIIGLLYYFLKTNVGMYLRATGDNPEMVKNSSINADMIKVLGFTLCNGFVGLSGALYSQYSQTATIGVGSGMLVLGLANIIIGETLFNKKSILFHIVAIVLGSLVYRLILTFAFQVGLVASDIKIFSALIVIIAIAIPHIKTRLGRRNNA